MQQRTGGRVLVDHLVAFGVSHAFCVPGESYLAVLDALHERAADIAVVSCRHENGAAFMAEAAGKLTGRPGVAFVTRGPGAANAAIGVHTARQDSTPMVLFVGQVGRDMLGREAFQEIDFRKMFGDVAKHVEQVDAASRLPECLARAFAIAMSGRRGPVVVVLPEDVLTDVAEVADVALTIPADPSPGAADMQALRARIVASGKPLVVVGGSGWTETARADLAAFAEHFDLPVVAGFRCQDRMDNRHRLYVGELGTSVSRSLAQRMKDADLLVVVGERLGEMTTSGYTLIASPDPVQPLVHVLAGAEELGKVYRAEVAINAGVAPFLAMARDLEGHSSGARRAWAEAARSDHLAMRGGRAFDVDLDLREVMDVVRDRLGPDAIIANGAGNYTGWPQRHYVYRGFPTQLGPISGAMGYGVPAAIAAKTLRPEREVVCFSGDGCFMMTGQELATAVKYDVAVVFLVFDNGMYGTIRMHQERAYPGRVSATDLTNPDFAAFARSFGAHGETVRRTEEFAPAFDRARRSGRAAVVHLVVDPEVLSINASLSEVAGSA